MFNLEDADVSNLHSLNIKLNMQKHKSNKFNEEDFDFFSTYSKRNDNSKRRADKIDNIYNSFIVNSPKELKKSIVFTNSKNTFNTVKNLTKIPHPLYSPREGEIESGNLYNDSTNHPQPKSILNNSAYTDIGGVREKKHVDFDSKSRTDVDRRFQTQDIIQDKEIEENEENSMEDDLKENSTFNLYTKKQVTLNDNERKNDTPFSFKGNKMAASVIPRNKPKTELDATSLNPLSDRNPSNYPHKTFLNVSKYSNRLMKLFELAEEEENEEVEVHIPKPSFISFGLSNIKKGSKNKKKMANNLGEKKLSKEGRNKIENSLFIQSKTVNINAKTIPQKTETVKEKEN